MPSGVRIRAGTASHQVWPPEPGDDLAEEAVAEVGVVEPPIRLVRRARPVVGSRELVERAALRPLPPVAGRLGLQPAGVGEQLPDRPSA